MKGDPTCDVCWGTGFWKGSGAPCENVIVPPIDLGEVSIEFINSGKLDELIIETLQRNRKAIIKQGHEPRPEA